MKVLYLCKRHYMNHDVIEDRYARLYEQPFQLARLGNNVLACCLSYHRCSAKNESHEAGDGNLNWIGYPVQKRMSSILANPFKLFRHTKQFKPELIIAASDCIHVIIGYWLSKILNSKFAVDLYDDYETFGLSKIPFVKLLYRIALRRAVAISCVSQKLSEHIKLNIGVTAAISALPSTINKNVFRPKEKKIMREKFSLPLDQKIFGTAGGLTAEKGIDAVYRAALQVLAMNPHAHFAIAGPIDPVCPPPHHERIHYLGNLEHQKVADFFCALDVGIVYLKNTTYGQLSFPQKAYEMASCEIPMVVADVGDMSLLFSKDSNELYTADDSFDLAYAIQKQLESPNFPNLKIDDWQEHGKKLNQLYLDAQDS